MTQLIENRGINYERRIGLKLKNTPGQDGKPLLNRNWKQSAAHPVDAMFNHNGQHAIEIKENPHRAEFGQIAISHSPERGHHISDSARRGKEHLAAHVEASGILDRLNGHEDFQRFTAGLPTVTKSPEINHFVPGADAINDHYNHDKGVPYIHVGGGYGTYHSGDNPAGLNTSKLEGITNVRARVKNYGAGKKSKVVVSLNLHQPSKYTPKSKVSLDATPDTVKEEYNMTDLHERSAIVDVGKAAERLRGMGYVVNLHGDGRHLMVQQKSGTKKIHANNVSEFLRDNRLNEYNIHTTTRVLNT